MEGRWNLRGQRIQPRVWVASRLVCDLVDDGHNAGKSRRRRRCSGGDEETTALLNDVTVMSRSRERYIRRITMMLIGRAGIHRRHAVTGLPGWCTVNRTDATASAP